MALATHHHKMYPALYPQTEPEDHAMSATQTNPSQNANKGGPTKIRHVRCGDADWIPAAERANREGRNISEVVRLLLRDYGKGHIDV